MEKVLFRKVKVLVEEEREFEELRKGDIFRTLPASDSDVHANPECFYVADNNAKKQDPPMNCVIQATPIAFTKAFLPGFLTSTFKKTEDPEVTEG